MYVTIIKEGVKLVSSIGVGTIVGNTVKQVANPAAMNTFNKVCVTVGGAAITGLVSAKVGEYIDETIDGTVNSIKGLFKKEEKGAE